ncbi:MAG: transcriptional regulator, LacI family [Crocinitomicaceae bacterium]|jgi:LacI family transcriptional regulator|nr:transcriptional regulator, LacI family [Crocinitomicaceae bacterium]
MSNKKLSLSDLANILGISKSTVSFVLNNKGDKYNISKETQKLILEKAKELNFVPNFFAKSLREGKTKTIGLVVADISNAFYGELSKMIQEELYHHDYKLFIVNTNDNKEIELQLIRDLINRSIDGLIVAPCNPVENLKDLFNSTPIPIVFVDRYGDNKADFVGVNNYTESFNLIQKFSKKPDYLGVFYYEKDKISTIQLRINGIKDSCAKQNIKMELINVHDYPDNLTKKVEDLRKKKMDAGIALNNKVALQVLSSINDLKVNIPKEMAFISFDDSEAFPYLTTPVSALKQPIKEIGKETVNQLIRRLSEEQIPGKCVEFSCQFVARNSH